MDKSLLKDRFKKAANSYKTEATTQRNIATELWKITASVISDSPCDDILEVGCGTGFLTSQYQELVGKRITLNDIYDITDNFEASPKISYKIGDAEQIKWHKKFDLILSASSIQWFNDLEGFLENSHNSLNEGGIIALSTFGPDNFKEVRMAGGKSLNYKSKNELTEIFSKYFDLIKIKEETITLEFPDVRSILRHIKNTGVMGGLGSGASLRELLLFENKYNSQWQNLEYAPLTYHPIYIIGKKR